MHSDFRSRLALLSIAMILFLAPRAGAQSEAQWHDSITLNGFLSTSWTHGFNSPSSHLNGYRVFDFRENSLSLDVAEFVIRRDAVQPGEAGFRMDLAAGSSHPRVARSAGWSNPDLDLQQAYGSYLAPIGKGLRIDAGKFVTPFGYEVIDGFDGFNDNVSRSFLFGYAIPFTHTGLRLSYTFSDLLSATGFVANGWDNLEDNNSSKTLGAQFILTPAAGITVIAGGAWGPERAGNSSDNRGLADFSVIWKASEVMTFGVNADLGQEANAAGDSLRLADATWSGVAGYLRFNLHPTFSLCLRGELFDDTDGIRTGVQQKLSEVSITPEYRPVPGFIVRAELRIDTSDKDVFEGADEWKKNQSTASINLLWVW